MVLVGEVLAVPASPPLTQSYAVRPSALAVLSGTFLIGPHLNRGGITRDGHFQVTAKRIRQLHLPRRSAFRFEELRAAHQNHRGHRPGCCHIQSVQAVQKLHPARRIVRRSEEHTSELQSPVVISYAVFCLKKKKTTKFNKPSASHTHPQKKH